MSFPGVIYELTTIDLTGVGVGSTRLGRYDADLVGFYDSEGLRVPCVVQAVVLTDGKRIAEFVMAEQEAKADWAQVFESAAAE